MNKKIILILMSILLLFPAIFAEEKKKESKPKAKIKWEKIKSKNGILVYSRDDPNSSNVIFKGKAVVNKEMFLVIAVVGDVKNLTKWIETVKKATIVKQISDLEIILYNQFKAPWPLLDRDVVLQTKVKYDFKRDWIHIKGRNIKHPKYPERSGYVRIPYMRNHWAFKPIRNGKATWVELTVQVDPSGIIPAWISNMVSKDVPYKTLTNLRKRVKKGKFSREVLRKIERFATEHNLQERYNKRFGKDYIKSEEWYEKHYSLVD